MVTPYFSCRFLYSFHTLSRTAERSDGESLAHPKFRRRQRYRSFLSAHHGRGWILQAVNGGHSDRISLLFSAHFGISPFHERVINLMAMVQTFLSVNRSRKRERSLNKTGCWTNNTALVIVNRSMILPVSRGEERHSALTRPAPCRHSADWSWLHHHYCCDFGCRRLHWKLVYLSHCR